MDEEITPKKKVKHKKLIIAGSVCGTILLVILMLVYIYWDMLALYVAKEEIFGTGSYSFEVDCEIKNTMRELTSIWSLLGEGKQAVHLSIDKKNDLYHGTIRMKGDDLPFLEFYQQKNQVKFNLSTTLRYLIHTTTKKYDEKIVEFLKLDSKELIVSNDTFEELFGPSDSSIVQEFLQDFVSYRGNIKMCKIKKNAFTSATNEKGISFELGNSQIRVTADTGLIIGGTRKVYGCRISEWGTDDFYVSYKHCNQKKLVMPEDTLSRFEIAVIKELVIVIYGKIVS